MPRRTAEGHSPAGRAGRPDAYLDAPDVTVGPLGPDDEAVFLASVRASRALHHPWIDLADTPPRFAVLLARLERDDHRAYLVRHRPCGGTVGYVGISNIVRGAFQSAYLSYAAFSGHEGLGFMTTGVREVVRIAFHDLRLHRVEANIQPGNAPSIALVQRLGFMKEGYSPRYLLIDGEWRDHERWALRVEEAGLSEAPV